MQWEADCDFVEATFQQFVDWLNGTDLESETDNRLRQYNPTSHWCYADYNHMKELFCDYPDLMKVKIKILSLSCGIIYDHIF